MTSRASVWIGLDIGTRGVRAAAYSRDGRAVAEASIDRPPRVTDAGRMTHDPETDWWGGSVAALSTISDAVGGWQVEGIGLAGLFPAVALVGTDGIATSEGILHGDRRALHEIGTVAATLDVRLSGDEVSPRLVWLRDHEPAAMQAARVALGPAGYVGRRLTGVDSIDPHSAVRWGFGLNDLRSDWRREDLAGLRLPPGLLPPIHRPSEVIGAVTPWAAEQTGLRSGTPVVTGATDSLTQLIGDGVCMAGDALVYYGSSGTLLACTVDLDVALADPARFGDGSPYRLAAYAVNSGMFLERTRAELLRGRSYAELDALAEASPPGANGILVMPHVSGKLFPEERATSSGAIVGLSLMHSPGDIWRAMLESFGYVLMEAQHGLSKPPRAVTAAGGGARSQTWRRIVQEMTGWPQRVVPTGGSARGAAALAALGTGGLRSIQDVRDTWLAVTEGDLSDDAIGRKEYADRFARWLAVDRAIASANDVSAAASPID